eukprot:CAMPEP_0117484062 /NCGR_PEP_ID=MMETSP0784-20121206/14268_1 /TAXON_ID=39447 /ORGANISM="" /LENGTH=837 /DNA_ID=CAMNT_0005278631 /DNA_START=39 /DNA_END=2548 /DNA_ORIENTATION=+
MPAPTFAAAAVLLALAAAAGYVIVYAVAHRRGRWSKLSEDGADCRAMPCSLVGLEEGLQPRSSAPLRGPSGSAERPGPPGRGLLGELASWGCDEADCVGDVVRSRGSGTESFMEDVALLYDAVDEAFQQQGRLHDGLEDAQSKLAEVQAERQQLHQRLEAASSEVLLYEQQTAEVLRSVEAAHGEKNRLVADFEVVEARLRADEAERDRLVESQAEMRKELLRCVQESEEVQVVARRASEERQQLEEALMDARGSLEAAREQARAAQNAADDTRAAEASLRAELVEARVAVGEAEGAVIRTVQARAGAEEARVQTEELLAQARVEVADAEGRLAEGERGLRECQGEVAQLRKELRGVQDKTEAHSVMIANANAALGAAEKERQCILNAIQVGREALHKCEADVQDVRGQVSSVLDEQARAAAELESVREVVRRTESDQHELRNEHHRGRAELQRLSEAAADAAAESAAAHEKYAEMSASLAEEFASSRKAVETRLYKLQDDLSGATRIAVNEEIAPLRQDVSILQRRVDEHAGTLSTLQRRVGDLSPQSSRSASLCGESNHGGLSSCGVGSSGASTPNGSMGRGRILRGGSFCSSAGSESEASSIASRAILAGRSFASSDDDVGSEHSFGGMSGVPLLAGGGIPKELDNEALMDFAQALKPLLVTRKDLARVLTRVPEGILLSAAVPNDPFACIREALQTIFRSVVCIVRIGGVDHLAFARGMSYADNPYNIGRLSTSLLLRASPLFASPAGGTRPPTVPEGEDLPVGSEQTSAAVHVAAADEELKEVRLSDVSSRDRFLAELIGLFGTALRGAALHEMCGERALRHRRHALRHAKT